MIGFNMNSGNIHNVIVSEQSTTFCTIGYLIIYDTDFHSLDSTIRTNKVEDKKNAKWGKVTLSDNVFIGAHTTILKGVTIGENSIIGTCSLIAKDVPENEIWAGNPAQFIKIINI